VQCGDHRLADAAVGPRHRVRSGIEWIEPIEIEALRPRLDQLRALAMSIRAKPRDRSDRTSVLCGLPVHDHSLAVIRRDRGSTPSPHPGEVTVTDGLLVNEVYDHDIW